MMTLRMIQAEINRIVAEQPEKLDCECYIFTGEGQLNTEDIVPIDFIDDSISDRVDFNVEYREY